MLTIVRGMAEVAGRVLWLLTGAGAVFAAISFVGSIMMATGEVSAPQMAALSAQSLVFAIVPYVFSRAFDEIVRPWPLALGTSASSEKAAVA